MNELLHFFSSHFSLTLPPYFWGALAALSTSFTWVLGSSSYSRLSLRYHPSVINMNRALICIPAFGLFAISSLPLSSPISLSLSAIVPYLLWLTLNVICSYGLGDLFFFRSTLSIGFPAAQAISSLYPLWASIFGLIFLNEVLGQVGCLGMFMAVLGTISLVLIGNKQIVPQTQVKSPTFAQGIFLAIITSLLWAFSGLTLREGGSDLPLALVGFIRMILATLCNGILAYIYFAITANPSPQDLQGPQASYFFSREDYLKYIPLILMESFVGGCLYVYGLTHTPLAIGVTLSSLAPVLAIPIAVFRKWERFSWRKSLAILIVVIGSLLLVIFH